MAERKVAPYGSWRSPITSDLIASEQIGLGSPVLSDGSAYWLESRPSEGGRVVVVQQSRDGQIRDLTPVPFNARSRAHEYGGGAYMISAGTLIFSNFADGQLYRSDGGGEPKLLTGESSLRFADMTSDLRHARLLSVREDHRVVGQEPVASIVGIDLEGDEAGGTILLSGNDFYASPCVSPDGSRIAWLTWNHPNMPWDGCELWVGVLDTDGTVLRAEKIAGGIDESICQPQWSPGGVLHFVSDRTGWWNLYRWQNGVVESLCEMKAEFAYPQWVFGLSSYGFEAGGSIVSLYVQQGVSRLGRIDASTRDLYPIPTPYQAIFSLVVEGGQAIMHAAAPDKFESIVMIDLASYEHRVLRQATTLVLDESYLSMPESVEFPTDDGNTAFGFFYPPKNREFTAPEGERPPLVVMSHGGPTSATDAMLDLEIQYWTSRGLAVFDVNYGGSSGYGRAYRLRLNGNWGIVDVADCLNGARFLVAQGRVDGNRLAITGGSAGGYTTLCALTFHNLFSVGASHFGVGDLEALARETHKFESRYLDSLIGPYPERRDLYLDRSPVNFTERLSSPVIFFQGLDDEVVPPGQAEAMVKALRERGVPVAYVPFEGEGHGFRRAESIRAALDGELYFYSRIMGFDLAVPVEPVPIANWPGVGE